MIGRNYKVYNAAVIIYHFVCPAKYRNVVFSEALDMQIKEICLEIEKRYDIKFLEIGTDNKNVHFLVQTLPKLSPNQIIRTIKSIITDEIFERYPVVREKLWGGKLWSDEYYAASVSRYESQTAVKVYAENKGIEKEYRQLLLQPLILPGNAALFSTDTSRLLPKIFLLHRSQGSADKKMIYRVKPRQSFTHPNVISELTEHRKVQRAENQGQAKNQDHSNNEFARMIAAGWDNSTGNTADYESELLTVPYFFTQTTLEYILTIESIRNVLGAGALVYRPTFHYAYTENNESDGLKNFQSILEKTAQQIAVEYYKCIVDRYQAEYNAITAFNAYA